MESTGETWRLGRRPALDGLRGVAVVAVVIAHVERFPHAAAGGMVGVTMFFTLSGFLITALLLEELARHDRIDLWAFWGRRVRRLLPALLLLVVFVLAAGWVTTSDVWPALFYYGNWIRVAGGDMGVISHTWSLAVEEQFYLAWPLVLVLAARGGRTRRILFVASIGAALSIGARLAAWDWGVGWHEVYFGSHTRADSILLGCALAAYLHTGGRLPRVPGWPALLILAALCWTSGWFAYLPLPFLVALLTAVVIAADETRTVGHQLLRLPFLGAIGRRSYGVYLWHFPMLQVLAPTRLTDDVVVALLFTALIVEASYRFVELPARRIRVSGRVRAKAMA